MASGRPDTRETRRASYAVTFRCKTLKYQGRSGQPAPAPEFFAPRPPVSGPQSPSFFSTRSLTAAGAALPPVAFITWPTNQPASFGFCFAFSTWAGFSAMI